MKKVIGTFVLLLVLFTGTFVLAVPVVVATTDPCPSSGTPPAGCVSVVTGGGTPLASTPLQNPINVATFDILVEKVIEAAVIVLSPFVVLAFIYAGFLFVKAQGKAEELETAKQAIYWSVIGAFILMGAWGFAQIIGTTVRTITG